MSEVEKGLEQSDGSSTIDYAAMYKEDHPDAIEDSVKAEVMAKAGHLSEEGVVEHRAAALDAAGKIGEVGPTGYGHNERLADEEAAITAQQRAKADQQESKAASIYDQVTKL